MSSRRTALPCSKGHGYPANLSEAIFSERMIGCSKEKVTTVLRVNQPMSIFAATGCGNERVETDELICEGYLAGKALARQLW